GRASNAHAAARCGVARWGLSGTGCPPFSTTASDMFGLQSALEPGATIEHTRFEEAHVVREGICQPGTPRSCGRDLRDGRAGTVRGAAPTVDGAERGDRMREVHHPVLQPLGSPHRLLHRRSLRPAVQRPLLRESPPHPERAYPLRVRTLAADASAVLTA